MKICFTGHRPPKFGGYVDNNPPYDNKLNYIVWSILHEEIVNQIEQIRESRETITFITGMALGVDQWAASAARLARKDEESIQIISGHGVDVKLIAAIPFLGQEKNWPEQSQEQYRHLLNHCDDIYFVDEEGYAPWKLLNRNKWMVDNSDLVIAVWNRNEKGGTAHCVRYAKKQGKKVINLWEDIQKRLD